MAVLRKERPSSVSKGDAALAFAASEPEPEVAAMSFGLTSADFACPLQYAENQAALSASSDPLADSMLAAMLSGASELAAFELAAFELAAPELTASELSASELTASDVMACELAGADSTASVDSAIDAAGARDETLDVATVLLDAIDDVAGAFDPQAALTRSSRAAHPATIKRLLSTGGFTFSDGAGVECQALGNSFFRIVIGGVCSDNVSRPRFGQIEECTGSMKTSPDRAGDQQPTVTKSFHRRRYRVEGIHGSSRRYRMQTAGIPGNRSPRRKQRFVHG